MKITVNELGIKHILIKFIPYDTLNLGLISILK